MTTSDPDNVHVLNAMHQRFMAKGQWPQALWLDTELRDDGIDVFRVLKTLPRDWVWGDVSHVDQFPQRRIGLTVEALAQIDGTERTLELFLWAVREMAAAYRQFEEERALEDDDGDDNVQWAAHWTADDARSAGQTRDPLLLMIFGLIETQPRLRTSSSGPGQDPDGKVTWSIGADRECVFYENVRTIEEYLRIKHDRADARAKAFEPLHPVLAQQLALVGTPDPSDIPGATTPAPLSGNDFGYTATVVKVLIASPSDVGEDRPQIAATCWHWNNAYGPNFGLILLPQRWEQDAAPLYGQGPQDEINDQLVDASAAVIAVMRHRMGTPVNGSPSGTIAEIDRARSQGKPVYVYRSTEQPPPDADTDQLRALDEWCRSARGLIQPFEDTRGLTSRLMTDLSVLARRLRDGAPAHTDTSRSQEPIARQPNLRAELRHNPSGKGRVLLVHNESGADISELAVTLEPNRPGESPPSILDSGERPLVSAAQHAKFTLYAGAGSTHDFSVSMRWMRNGSTEHKLQSLSW